MTARILLDSNIPYRFKLSLSDLSVKHVRDVGLEDFLDGPLLDALDGRFDVFVTMDRGLPHQ